MVEVQLIENIQRDDLTELEEGDSYRALVKRGRAVEEIAARAGKSKAYVYARMKLAELPAAARKPIEEGRITASVGVLIARIHDPKRQEEAAAVLAPAGTAETACSAGLVTDVAGLATIEPEAGAGAEAGAG